MRCPFCSNEDTQVKDSRPADDNSSIEEEDNVQFVELDLLLLREFN